MQTLKRIWFSIPSHIRKPITLTIGMIFVVAAGLTGWLPGPGGIPLFLIGITILATEFQWAERIKQKVLSWVQRAGAWIRLHPKRGSTIIALAIVGGLSLTYFFIFK